MCNLRFIYAATVACRKVQGLQKHLLAITRHRRSLWASVGVSCADGLGGCQVTGELCASDARGWRIARTNPHHRYTVSVSIKSSGPSGTAPSSLDCVVGLSFYLKSKYSCSFRFLPHSNQLLLYFMHVRVWFRIICFNWVTTLIKMPPLKPLKQWQCGSIYIIGSHWKTFFPRAWMEQLIYWIQ